jgi:hypothetical protein
MYETNYSHFLNHRNIVENNQGEFEQLEGIKVTEGSLVNNEVDINEIKVNTIVSARSRSLHRNTFEMADTPMASSKQSPVKSQMEFSNTKRLNLNATTQILKKFSNKENLASGVSLSSSRSKKTVNVEKTLDDFNQKLDLKLQPDDLKQLKIPDNAGKNDILKIMIAFKLQ